MTTPCRRAGCHQPRIDSQRVQQEQPADAFTLLTTAPPELSEAHAAELLREHYDLAGTLKLQYSERDQNFLVRTATGSEYVLKIANSAEIPTITDLQLQALLHLENSHPDIPVPRVVSSVDDETSIRITAKDGRRHTARVLSWLPGTLSDFENITPDTAANIGAALARLGVALRDFEHPASDYPLLWDLKQAGKLVTLIDTVADTSLRAIFQRHLDVFVNEIEPRLPDLRSQVIHNDLNPGNVLFNPDNKHAIAGIIDFGDMIRSPLVVDVAVACAYLCENDDAPFANVLEFVNAYHAETPLLAEEFELLPYLIIMRNLTTVMISHWRASLYPENRDYISTSEGHAVQMVATLGQHEPAAVGRALREFCDDQR